MIGHVFGGLTEFVSGLWDLDAMREESESKLSSDDGEIASPDCKEDVTGDHEQKANPVQIREKLKLSFTPIFGAFTRIKEHHKLFQKEVSDHNSGRKLKLRIGFGARKEGARQFRVWFGYRPEEFKILCLDDRHSYLMRHFSVGGQTLFDYPDIPCNFELISLGGIDDLKIQRLYSALPLQEREPISLNFPAFDPFTGNPSQIEGVFGECLRDHPGVLVGVDNEEPTVVHALKEQMTTLSAMGVKTLFLQHCYYDTLQPELDAFFSVKRASPFLENYLRRGLGQFNPKMDYYNLVAAAVHAGIKPVALNHSRCSPAPFSQVETRAEIIKTAFTVGAMQIIARHTQEDKYIVLIEPEMLSYSHDVPGLGELLHLPTLYMRSSYDSSDMRQSVSNLGLESGATIYRNREKTHFVHAFLKLEERTDIEGGKEWDDF